MTTPNFADKTVWTGDNLDILRGMNSDCVDLIYLDPPFNSNRNYPAPVGSAAHPANVRGHGAPFDTSIKQRRADHPPAKRRYPPSQKSSSSASACNIAVFQ